MKNIHGFPENFGYFQVENKHIIAHTLFGPSIRMLYEFCNSTFTLRTICLIFLEALRRLQDLHIFGFLHNVINMQNLTWGKFQSGKLNN